ncbi:MAG TPA: DUF4136 domain-containing protein [Acidobacteriaceae bacterium]|jgi:hypothetical protein
MMKARIQPLFPFPVLLILALVPTHFALSQKVLVDWDRGADFSKYKTFSWGRVVTINPLWDGRVESAIAGQLTVKGWTYVPEGGDTTVMAVQATRTKPTLVTFYDGFGGWHWRGFGTSTTTIENYKEGDLVVDIFDTSTERLLWRGVAVESLSDSSEKNIKALNKAVQKLFENFPPPPGK